MPDLVMSFINLDSVIGILLLTGKALNCQEAWPVKASQMPRHNSAKGL